MTNKEIDQLKKKICEKLNVPMKMNGADLKRIRERLKISKEEFTYECGWSLYVQSMLEISNIDLHSTCYIDTILTTLVNSFCKKFGISK